jgi:hypothetical protein
VSNDSEKDRVRRAITALREQYAELMRRNPDRAFNSSRVCRTVAEPRHDADAQPLIPAAETSGGDR